MSLVRGRLKIGWTTKRKRDNLVWIRFGCCGLPLEVSVHHRHCFPSSQTKVLCVAQTDLELESSKGWVPKMCLQSKTRAENLERRASHGAHSLVSETESEDMVTAKFCKRRWNCVPCRAWGLSPVDSWFPEN